MIKLNYPQFWLKRGMISLLLIPFSWIYILLSFLRKLIITPIKLPGFVICIGNMSVGGTGKTQVTKWLASNCQKNNYNFLIITKAYGAKIKKAKIVEKTDLAEYVGDESKLLSLYGPVLAAKSLKYALPLINQLKPDIIIFDDGMQNPAFIKDLTILVIDTIRNVGNNKIFPAGPLRVNISHALSKADIITFTGNRSCNNFNLIQTIIDSKKPFFKSKMQLKTDIDKTKNYYAFAGIGNPSSFVQLLKENGANIVLKKAFPDHYNYTNSDIKQLIDEADSLDLQLITTQKDFVKINDETNIVSVEVDLYFENETQLFNIINEKIKVHI
ncbi:MAG: tetraacyldisaccharide 4'-kinase [Rickettsiales bacterium]|nr:MAG: tetraacyldisaccharide 4'-kinase [Rickettsiales bacterium]